jgi:hypothetical protein
MNLPIEIINHIAQFTNYKTFTALKCTNKEINNKVIYDELIKKYISNKVYNIYQSALSSLANDIYSSVHVRDNKSLLYAIDCNKDRFTCLLCHYSYIDCLNDEILIEHFKYCPGYFASIGSDDSDDSDDFD